MKEKYWQGESIFVHKNYWENGYFLAWRNGIYGYVMQKLMRITSRRKSFLTCWKTRLKWSVTTRPLYPAPT